MSKSSFTNLKNEAGFSLIELVIVSLILTIILGITTSIFVSVQSSYNSRREQAGRLSDATAALDLISRVVRNAGNNTTQTALTATGNYRLIVKGDWNPANGVLTNPYENVEFLVSNGTLYAIDNSPSTPIVTPISEGISSIYFQYFNASGGSTTTMSQVSRIKITLTIAGSNSRTLTSSIAIRNKIQPIN